MIAIGTYCVARSVSTSRSDEILTVGSAQALGYVAALATLVAPAGLGVRDAVFAWAVKARGPGRQLRARLADRDRRPRGPDPGRGASSSLGVTALGRRQGWSIHTGVFHPSPEEEAAEEAERRRGRGRGWRAAP